MRSAARWLAWEQDVEDVPNWAPGSQPKPISIHAVAVGIAVQGKATSATKGAPSGQPSTADLRSILSCRLATSTSCQSVFRIRKAP